MKRPGIHNTLLLSGLSATALYAAQPPDPVGSLENSTAVGAGALASLSASSCKNLEGVLCSYGNTAVGINALSLNSSGAGNTAVGSYALKSNTTGLYNTAVGAYSLFNTSAAGDNNGNGNNNTGLGYGSLYANTSGKQNTGLGSEALTANTTGSRNTAVGAESLASNTSGYYSTALGFWSLQFNTTGYSNTGLGSYTLRHNTTGYNNTAAGSNSLTNTTTGYNNTAAGIGSLYNNTTGFDNTAVGGHALETSTVGYDNNAMGYNALESNTTGYNNNAQGSFALTANTTGYGNSAMGANSLLNLTTGWRNVGVGNNTGTVLTTGTYNIDIGWGVGASGTAAETGVIRIGDPSVATSGGFSYTTYIAGISTSQITGAAVYVTAAGQLGVLASSERYKSEISPMPAQSTRLQQLRPVTFHLRNEPQGNLQYGLIAEEVDKVYPELVIRDEQGQVQGVRYDELAPILLNQVQQEEQRLALQEQQLASEHEALLDERAQRIKVQQEERALIAAQAADARELRQQMAEVQQLKVTLESELDRLHLMNDQLTMR
ncbi:MAG: tail fiber domain-containing protein [Steroidobacteraceae bacterium]